MAESSEVTPQLKAFVQKENRKQHRRDTRAQRHQGAPQHSLDSSAAPMSAEADARVLVGWIATE